MKSIESKTPCAGSPHTRTERQPTAVRIKTGVRAGGMSMQHNETLARASKPQRSAGVKVKTKVRAGGINMQHNETLVRASRPGQSGVKVKTKVRAGGVNMQHNETLVRARNVQQ